MKAKTFANALAICVTLSASFTVPALAQTTPTGSITGQVEDAQGGLLPGVTVTAISPSLQGARTAVTSKNGDYIIPFLAAGEYTVKFELSGFSTKTMTLRVQLAETVAVNARLQVGGLTEEVLVTGEARADFTQSSTAAASYKADQIERLPEPHRRQSDPHDGVVRYGHRWSPRGLSSSSAALGPP